MGHAISREAEVSVVDKNASGPQQANFGTRHTNRRDITGQRITCADPDKTGDRLCVNLMADDTQSGNDAVAPKSRTACRLVSIQYSSSGWQKGELL